MAEEFYLWLHEMLSSMGVLVSVESLKTPELAMREGITESQILQAACNYYAACDLADVEQCWGEYISYKPFK